MQKVAVFRTFLAASVTFLAAVGCGGVGVVGGQEVASTEKTPAMGGQCFGSDCIDTLKPTNSVDRETEVRTKTPEPNPPEAKTKTPEAKTKTTEPKPEQCVWEEVQCWDFRSARYAGECNGHRGDDFEACLAAGNDGCTDEELNAHCRRRVDPEPSNDWYRLHREWVEARCDNDQQVDFVENSAGQGIYSCKDEAACKIYKCITPIVLQFGDGELALRPFVAAEATTRFDLSSEGDGSASRTDWPTAATPWLAFDRDGDGVITSGRELFGSATLVNGRPAAHGFEALAVLDVDANGVIDAADPAFSQLRVWADANGDRVSQPDELQDLCDAGVTSLSLVYVASPRCDRRGNCGIERAPFTYRAEDGTLRFGSAVDLHLVSR